MKFPISDYNGMKEEFRKESIWLLKSGISYFHCLFDYSSISTLNEIVSYVAIADKEFYHEYT